MTHLLDLAKFLQDDALPAPGRTPEADPGGQANDSRPPSGRRSSYSRRSEAAGLFRRALAMANATCLEAVRLGLVGMREQNRRAGDLSRADVLNTLLSEAELRLSIFRDLRIGGAVD